MWPLPGSTSPGRQSELLLEVCAYVSSSIGEGTCSPQCNNATSTGPWILTLVNLRAVQVLSVLFPEMNVEENTVAARLQLTRVCFQSIKPRCRIHLWRSRISATP